MPYKKKLIILLSLIVAMAVIYILSSVFNYDRSNARSLLYTWLDPKSAVRISRIAVDNGYEKYELVKRNEKWFLNFYGREFPAKKLRIEDFLSFFTARASWPVRSESASSHERLGLGEDSPRITIYGEYSVLLDVLLGYHDTMGNDMYFRKVGLNEVRSGDGSIWAYIAGNLSGWYNLRLFPESADGGLNSSNVQRVTVYNENKMQIFTRRSRTWDITEAAVVNPDISEIESYINFIVNAEGDDFIDPEFTAEADFNHSRIIVEFGSGAITEINMSDPDEAGKRYAKVSGSGLIYVIPLWVSLRLIRDASSFEML